MSGPKEVGGCVLLRRGSGSRPEHSFATESEFKTVMDLELTTKLSLVPLEIEYIINLQSINFNFSSQSQLTLLAVQEKTKGQLCQDHMASPVISTRYLERRKSNLPRTPPRNSKGGTPISRGQYHPHGETRSSQHKKTTAQYLFLTQTQETAARRPLSVSTLKTTDLYALNE